MLLETYGFLLRISVLNVLCVKENHSLITGCALTLQTLKVTIRTTAYNI